MLTTKLRPLAGAALATSLTIGAPAVFAQDNALPGTVVWTTYDTGGAMHSAAVAISSALKQNDGVNLRVISAGNGAAQQSTLKAGRADFVLAGFDVYFAQEGAFQFGAADWGPQPVRLVMTSMTDQGFGLAIAPELAENVKGPGDLRGLRIAFVQGSPSIAGALQALVIACGDMTWDDVQRVEVPGFGASVDAYINDQADVYFTSTNSGTSVKADASSRGLGWVPVPFANETCWEAIRATDPRWIQKVVTEGVNIPEGGIEMASYPDMLLNTTADRDAGYVQAMLKAIYDNFDDINGATPTTYGLELDRQILSYTVPFHDGAIAYFKEAGVWTDEMQAHNDRLVARQDALKAAWDAVVAMNISDEAEFAAAWKAKRIEMLEAGGFDVPVRDW
ncbi:TRAP transporter solute receptor, TAXI family [Salipiger thiooxidans]|uniref:TRAP transporter solute receptor, TAXI family n=1 Tax=Salipiger thiooxidans TaxID=282683 RepID=A0A1G7LHL2_9RHOB|nr:TAXI family TRAP transporter solute-binding subunit [Salipiger thiooxidans]SDF48866.1 TRAP transporter solute receptor, TAXI family [Salipiger thiooxidans]